MSDSKAPTSEELGTRLAVIAIAYAAVIAMLPSLYSGTPFGQSYLFNLNWYECFAEQLWAGEIYPRWLAGLWGGAGASDFFFYGPLPFYITALISVLCVGCTPEMSFAIGFTVIHFLSGISFLIFARDLAPMKLALLGAIAYLFVPFHVGDSWFLRQAAGEFLAFALLPLVVHFVRQLVLERKGGGFGLALSVAALGFSHLPSLVTTSVFIGVGAVYFMVTTCSSWSKRGRLVVRLGLSWGIGMCLIGFYWVPAVLLLDDVSPGHFYMEHLLWENWLFFDGKPEPFDSVYGDRLKRYLVFSTAFAGFTLWRGNQIVRIIFPWIFLPILTTWIFVTPVSWPAWEYLPVLEKIQLPYRFFYVFDFGLAASVMAIAPTGPGERGRRILVGLCLFVWLLFNYNRANSVDMTHFPEDSRAWLAEARAARFGPAEYLAPVGLEKGILIKEDQDELAKYMAIPQLNVVPSPAVEGALVAVDSRHYVLEIDLERDSVVTVKRQHWKHWQARLRESGEGLSLRPSLDYGLVEFDLRAGVHTIDFNLPRLEAERKGIWLSLIGLFGLLVLAFRERRPSSS